MCGICINNSNCAIKFKFIFILRYILAWSRAFLHASSLQRIIDLMALWEHAVSLPSSRLHYDRSLVSCVKQESSSLFINSIFSVLIVIRYLMRIKWQKQEKQVWESLSFWLPDSNSWDIEHFDSNQGISQKKMFRIGIWVEHAAQYFSFVVHPWIGFRSCKLTRYVWLSMFPLNFQNQSGVTLTFWDTHSYEPLSYFFSTDFQRF